LSNSLSHSRNELRLSAGILSLLLATCSPSVARLPVADTLTISFARLGALDSKVLIDSVIDHRGGDGRLLGRYEKNKYLFVPVDYLIYAEKPLSHVLCEGIRMPADDGVSPRFRLVVDEFNLTKKTNSRLFPRYLLHSSVQVYRRDGRGEPAYVGRLLFETAFRKPLFGDRLEKGFKTVTRTWRWELFRDLARLENALAAGHPPALGNLRTMADSTKPVNLIAGLDLAVTPRHWLVDGEVSFSPREGGRRFFRSGYSIRYRHAASFESIEFALADDCLFHRRNSRTLFRLQSRLYYGFNRWNDFRTTEHELWDAFILDYSLSQSLIYNPLDRSSLILGLGLLENAYYIYSHKTRFQLGLLINLGIKL